MPRTLKQFQTKSSCQELYHYTKGLYYPLNADAKIPGSAKIFSFSAKYVNLFAVVCAVLLETNQGGLGAMCNSPCSKDRGKFLKGPVATVFSVLSNKNALCTTPIPDWILS